MTLPGPNGAGDAPYPPPDHLLRHLGLELDVVAPDRARAVVDAGPALAGRAGAVPVGALTTAVDVLAGTVVGRAVAPDWMATAGLALHLRGPVAPGDLVLDATVARGGRTTVVLEVVLTAGAGAEVGRAVCTFVRLPRREGAPDLSVYLPPVGGHSAFDPPPGPVRPYAQLVGQRVLDAGTGTTSTDLTARLRNSFGACNGGVVAGLAASAAEVAATGTAGDGPVGAPAATGGAIDVEVHYLAQARTGPLFTSATVVRRRPDHVAVRVEVVEPGAGDEGGARRCALAHVVVGLAGDGVAVARCGSIRS